MTTASVPSSAAARDTLQHTLEPVREALLRDARAQAELIVSTATNLANELLTTAETEADAEVDGARHRAELAAQAHTQQGLAQARRDAHRVVLDGQNQLREQLLDAVHTSARQFRHDPRYQALLDQLEAVARSQLGDETVIERDPEPDGGVIAEAGSRRVDYRLVQLADRALDALSDDVVELWN